MTPAAKLKRFQSGQVCGIIRAHGLKKVGRLWVLTHGDCQSGINPAARSPHQERERKASESARTNAQAKVAAATLVQGDRAMVSVIQTFEKTKTGKGSETMIGYKFKLLAVASVVAACVSGSAFSADRATKDEAVAMVKKAVAAIKANADATRELQ